MIHRRKLLTVVEVASVGRSGSTLIEDWLAAVGGLVALGEIAYVWDQGVINGEFCSCGAPFQRCEFWQEVGKVAFGGWPLSLARRMIEIRTSKMRIRNGLGRQDPSGDLKWYSDIMHEIYLAAATICGVSAVIESSKLIGHIRVISRDPRIDVKTVHLVRDPRGVSYSWTRKIPRFQDPVGNSTMPIRRPILVAAEWSAINLLIERNAASISVQHRQLYESFACSPYDEAVAMIKGLSMSPVTKSEPSGTLHAWGGNPSRFLPRSGVNLDEQWREGMGKGMRRSVWAISGPVARRYGYKYGGLNE